MRRLLATGAAVGVIAAPAAIAIAAETTEETRSSEAGTSVRHVSEEGHRQIRAARAELRRERAAERRRKERRQARRQGVPVAASAGGGSVASPQLEAIAACESGGDPSAIGGGGQFRGKYQFTYSTWASVGGSGDPAAAPEAEQDRRAAMLLAQSGSSPWPVCGG